MLLPTAPAAVAAPAEPPASWQRWLEPAAQTFAFSPRVVLEAGERPLDEGNRDATQTLLEWTRHALRLIQKYQHNPLRATRGLAIVHAAMHDALVVAAADDPQSPPNMAAAHRAASLTLAYLYPYEPVMWIEGRGLALGHAWARVRGTDPALLARGIAAGERAAGDAIRWALTDGADRRPGPPRPVAPSPARWRATPPLNIHTPQELLAAEWRPWLRASAELWPPAPPAYGSERFLADTREVYRVSQTLTPEQKRIANEWNLQAGSVTPPGVWNQKALELIEAARLEAPRAVRLLAALNVAMHDAGIACWRAKYRWWLVRPVTVIRELVDADFLPYVVTPPHPSYVSGHSTISGAAEIVLAAFLPERAREMNALAEEAAESRLYAGIHFRADNNEGLALGRRIGALVAGQVLGAPLPLHGAGTKP